MLSNTPGRMPVHRPRGGSDEDRRVTTQIRAFVTAACVTSALLACGSDSHPVDAGTEAGADAGHDYRACNVPSDCIVVPESCCGSCGAQTRGGRDRDRDGPERGVSQRRLRTEHGLSCVRAAVHRSHVGRDLSPPAL